MKLNLNCSAEYVSSFLTKEESTQLYQRLLTHEELTAPFTLTLANGADYQEKYGKMMFIDAILFDEQKFPAWIWGPNKVWSSKMKMIKDRVESYTGQQFATCVCIYYPDGNSGVDFHSDKPAFGDTTVIASLSIGEERIFQLREKETGKAHDFLLENGSLFLMGEHCQDRYEHSLPLDSKSKGARINLTFRKFGFDD